LIVRSATKVTRPAVEAGQRLEVIGRAGAGVDSIDVDAATKRGVIVMNTPGGNTTAVAEHTLGLLLALARRLPSADVALKARRSEPPPRRTRAAPPQARHADHQLRPRRPNRRAAAGARDPGGQGRGRRARRVRAGAAAPRSSAAPAGASDRDTASGRRDRRSA